MSWTAENDQGAERWLFINDWPMRRYLIFGFATLLVLTLFLACRWLFPSLLGWEEFGYFLVPFIIAVPGSALLRCARVHDLSLTRSAFYGMLLGLLFIMTLGFGLNLLHYAGLMYSPLTFGPIAITYVLGTAGAVLLGWKMDRNYHSPPVTHRMGFWTWVQIAIAILVPLITVIGTQAANSDNERTILVIAVLAVSLAPLYLLARRSGGHYELLILSVSLTLLLHRALITNFVMGYDIMTEYSGAVITIDQGYWNVFESSMLKGAGANTALSIVTLAPMLNGLTGISALMLLKAVYPVVFALLPLGLYKIVEGRFDRRVALVGVLAFMAYPPFYALMIQLTKQQVAELFLVGMLLILTDVVLTRSKKRWLFLMFLLGVMVSHYAIAFLTMGALALLFFIHFLVTYLGNWRVMTTGFGPRSIWKWLVSSTKDWWHEQRRVRIVTLDIIILVGVFFLIWYSITASGLQLRYFAAGGESISQAEVVGGSATIQQFDAIEALLIDYGSPTHNFEKYLTLIMQIVMLIGLAYILTKSFRDKDKLRDEYLLLGIVGAILIGMAYTIPNFSRQLYFGRLFQFSYLFIAGYFFFGIFFISRLITELRGKRSDPSWDKAKVTNGVCVVLLVLMFAFGTSLVYALDNEYSNSTALSSKVSYAYFTDTDMVMGEYISNSTHLSGTSVIADWHRFPLFLALGTPHSLMPYSININDTNKFVYISSWMATTGWGYPLTVNGSATMTYCDLDSVMGQLNGSYDVVYTVGDGYLYYIPTQTPNTNPPAPPMYTYQTEVYYFVDGVVIALALLCVGVGVRKAMTYRNKNKN